ncbi:hypothetical protein I7I53_03969 [Histoplasma capsulatum var. duboisii H88]|uniref:Uncharacterized protein n=1 Tax=Ajellomyces capsulatus (strain H88) TaxID=544711 RepID=A0A8A1LV08_AJEC8|nr:hypothetical protein I7I53_03969 [Histoplasma capsulatum var. duboisii H88]
MIMMRRCGRRESRLRRCYGVRLMTDSAQSVCHLADRVYLPLPLLHCFPLSPPLIFPFFPI